MFRPTKTKSHQTEQIDCSLSSRSGDLALPLFLDRRHAIDEGADDPRRHCLMLHHRQMAAIAQEYGLHLRQELRHP